MFCFCISTFKLNIKNNHKSSNTAHAFSESSCYAKITTDCNFYKSSNIEDNSLTNIYFLIPNSYFICVIEQNTSFIKARYLNFVGYCNASLVSIVSFRPQKPYLTDVFFNLSASSGTQLRTSPEIKSDNILTTIPAATENLKYIAEIIGETPSGGSSNIWYYTEFSPAYSPTEVYYGYVYSDRVSTKPMITPNLEVDLEENPSDNLTSNSAEAEYETAIISDKLKLTLIFLMCLPIITIFIIILVKHKLNLKHKLAETNQNISLNNQPKSNYVKQNKSNINTKAPIKLFKNKPFYKKQKPKVNLFSSKEFSIEDLDETDDLL